MVSRTLALAAVSLGLGLVHGCGGGGGAALPTGHSPIAATLRLEYQMALDGAMSSAAADVCLGHVTVQPSFRGFAPTNLAPTKSGSWAALFEQVPIGRQTLRFRAPVGCEAASVTVNGRELSAILDGGDGEGLRTSTFAITVHADGTLSP